MIKNKCSNSSMKQSQHSGYTVPFQEHICIVMKEGTGIWPWHCTCTTGMLVLLHKLELYRTHTLCTTCICIHLHRSRPTIVTICTWPDVRMYRKNMVCSASAWALSVGMATMANMKGHSLWHSWTKLLKHVHAVFRQFRLIGCTYELLRHLHVEFRRFLMTTDRWQTDKQ